MKELLKFTWRGFITAPSYFSLIFCSAYIVLGCVTLFMARGSLVNVITLAVVYGAFISFYLFVFYKNREWHRKENSKQVMARIKGGKDEDTNQA